MRAERDGVDLVRRLGDDEGDRPRRGSVRGGGRDEQEQRGENGESAHVTDTRESCRAVPVSYGVAVGGA